MYSIIILMSNLLNFIYGTHYVQECFQNTEDLIGKNYIYVNNAMTWNDAERVCTNDLGGHLAKTDRQSIIEILKDLNEHEWSTLTTDVWVGLIEPENGSRLWVDCGEWNSGDWNNFANDAFNRYKQCYKLRVTSDWKWESTMCWEKYHFICENIDTGNCTFRDRPLLYDTVLLNLTETECSFQCLNFSDCYALMWNETSQTCYHVINNTNSMSSFKVKICYTGTTHEVSALCPENNSLIPVISCISTTLTSSISFESVSPSPYVYPFVSSSALKPYQVIHINDIRVAVAGCDEVSFFDTTYICPTATLTTVEFSSLMLDSSAMFHSMTSVSILTPTTNSMEMASTESHVENCTCKESIYILSQYVTCSRHQNRASKTVPDVKGLVSNLTVDKKSTGSFQRLQTSAKDNRPSAIAVGTLGILFLVLTLLLILTPDVISFALFLKKMYSKQKSKIEKRKRQRKNERIIKRRINGPFPEFYPAYSGDVK